MKKLILFIFLAISFISQSQSRLGYSYTEIRKEFGGKYEYTSGYSDKLGKYLEFYTEISTINYYFDYNNTCNLVLVLPKSPEDLHYHIESYNSRYVIVDDDKWKIYIDGEIVNVELLYAEDGGYFFMFYLDKK